MFPSFTFTDTPLYLLRKPNLNLEFSAFSIKTGLPGDVFQPLASTILFLLPLTIPLVKGLIYMQVYIQILPLSLVNNYQLTTPQIFDSTQHQCPKTIDQGEAYAPWKWDLVSE